MHGGIYFDSRGRVMAVSFVIILRNIGRSPAFDVQIFRRLITDSGGEQPLVKEKEACRNEEDSNRLPGPTMFPGDPATAHAISLIVSYDYINKFAGIMPDSKIRYIRPMIVGCVAYRFYLSDEWHTTSFFADINEIDATGVPALIDPDGPNIPQERVWASDSLTYQGAAN